METIKEPQQLDELFTETDYLCMNCFNYDRYKNKLPPRSELEIHYYKHEKIRESVRATEIKNES